MARRSYKSGDSMSKWYYWGYEKAYHESYHDGYDVGYASVYDTEYANGTTQATVEGERNATSSFNSMNNYNLNGVTEPYNVLRFTARAKSTVGFTNYNGNESTMYWRLKGGSWAGYSSGTSFTLNAGEYVEVYGDNIDGFSKSSSVYTKFNITGAVECTGKVSALISGWIDTFEIPSEYCFYRLFYNCTGLLTAPELPATTLAHGCYSNMFYGCSALTAAPELPATTLDGYCYYYMFKNCTALTAAPELTATTLVTSCYQYMFEGCTALTSAPELPATTLATYCYNSMFQGCSALTTAPELPATELANYCYYRMFYSCGALTVAPVLPATELATGCYTQMFYSCRKLQIVEAHFTSWGGGSNTNRWLSYAGTEAFKPTVFCPSESDINEGSDNGSVSGIPTAEGWQRADIDTNVVPDEYLEDYNLGLTDGASVGMSDGEAQGRASGTSAGVMNGYYDNIKIHFYTNLVGYSESLSKSGNTTGIVRRLAFSAASTGSTLSIINYNYNDVLLFYSFDGNSWSRVIFRGLSSQETVIITNKNGTTTYLMGFNIGSLNKSSSTYINIVKSNTEMSVVSGGNTGDINALKLGINIGGYIRAARAYDFYGLFKDNTTLLTAPELPATTLAINCYAYMFRGCSALTAASELPATTLAGSCYQYMFYGCSTLTSAPALPATTLVSSCYDGMFYGCSALTYAPELPATTLATNCYNNMFNGCSALTSASELPATTLATNCYREMFSGCSALTAAPELPATTLMTSCYQYMFYNCSKLNYIKVRATSWNTSYAQNWVSGVQKLKGCMFHKPTSLEIGTGTGQIPQGSDHGIPLYWGVVNF